MNIKKDTGICKAFRHQENSLFSEFNHRSLVGSHCVRSLIQQLILEIRSLHHLAYVNIQQGLGTLSCCLYFYTLSFSPFLAFIVMLLLHLMISLICSSRFFLFLWDWGLELKTLHLLDKCFIT